MEKQFLLAIEQICEEKGISKEKVVETIEMALAAAYKKDYGKKGQIIKVDFDTQTGSMKVNQIKLVVDESMIYSEEELEEMKEKPKEMEEGTEEDKKIRFNPEKHIMIDEAKKINPKVKVGEEMIFKLPAHEDFGRIAAQTAKQVIIQRIREAERDSIYHEYKDKEGEIVSGIVQRVEKGIVFIDIEKVTGVVFPEEQSPSDDYITGKRMKLYVMQVQQEAKGPSILLSRAYPKLVSKLFELEVPEVSSGIVEIKAIAREPGSRTKIAVYTEEEGVDPIGSCVGQKGTRVQAVINELNENIDIIQWDEDPITFVANSLSPAKVMEVKQKGKRREATATIAEDQLSLAIGQKGQNVRLAAKLTGWKIEIVGAKDGERKATDQSAPVEDKQLEDKSVSRKKKEKRKKEKTKKKSAKNKKNT